MAALLANKGVRWIGGGWAFFIAENLILSHNRSEIINGIGDGNYHTVYNTLSTAACGSIGYGFFKHRRTGGPIFKPPRVLLPLGLSCTLLGVVGFSQLVPALQLPYTSEPKHAQQQQQPGPSPRSAPVADSAGYRARCPIDFSPGDTPADGGLQRVSRHPTFWSLGLVGLGLACSTPFIPEIVMCSSPMLFCMIGTAHQDWRYRRGLGGTLDAETEARTSNVPFVALMQGRQDWKQLDGEMKWVNAGLAAGFATFWQLSRLNSITSI